MEKIKIKKIKANLYLNIKLTLTSIKLSSL